MENLISKFDNKELNIKPEIDKYDYISSKKTEIFGISLTKEILCTKYDGIYSFRVKPENVISISISIKDLNLFRASKIKIDRAFLEEYFLENNDNPFAIQFIFQLINRNIDINKNAVITQFPPVNLNKSYDIDYKFKSIIPKLKTGDFIFMYNKKSSISKKIRIIDYSQWSHLCLIYKNPIIQDMTTSGMIRYNINEIDIVNYDIAFYRNVHIEMSDEESIKRMDEIFDMRPTYNWIGVFKALLFRKYKFFRFLSSNTWKYLTPFDWMNSNSLKLIDFL